MNNNKRLNIKVVGGIFLVIIALFLFLSRTIYTYHLPTVTAVAPTNGTLYKSEMSTGLVDWADVKEVYSEFGGIVEEVHVEEGAKIKKGQTLFELSYDEDEINNKLKELDVNQNKISVDIETIQIRMDEIRRNITVTEKKAKEDEPETAYDLNKIENQISKLEDQIENASEDVEKSQILYEGGAISQEELEASQNTLKNLEYDLNGLLNDYENQKIAIQNKIDNYDKTIEDYKNKIKEYQFNLHTLEQELKTKKLDLKNLQNQEENYQSSLTDFKENSVIVASEDATMISVLVKPGQFVNANQVLLSYAVGSDYILECDITLDNDFVTVGDTCEITNASHTLDGIVTKITPEEGRKKVTLSFASEEVTTGETFEVEFAKESETSYTLVSNGAVNMDSDGYFIYQIKKRKGVLGDEFYVDRLDVYVGDSNNDNTAIVEGIEFFEPVVLLSDKAFSDGETIKVENVGDFFEN